MVNRDSLEKIGSLEKELRTLEDRLGKTKAQSSDAFALGGDGWHDNPAFDLITADIDKISSLIEEVKKEMIDLQGGAKHFSAGRP